MIKHSKLPLWRAAGLAALVALAAGTLGSGALSASASSSSSNKVITWAEGVSAIPDYISPMASLDYFSTVNLDYFSFMVYRPLYWFGTSGAPTLNTKLSIADAPIYSNDNHTVVLNMKHWKWSDGTPVTARDVIFWMNLLEASVSPAAANINPGSSTAPGPGWGSAAPGLFPLNISSYTATGTYQVTMQITGNYDPTWFTYNELAQITPIPQQLWDKTSASTPVGNYDETVPGTASSGALAVAQFINSESQDTATYDTNPLWKVVDGPFKLAQYESTGYVKFVPNTAYSGPDKAKEKAFEEIPFLSPEAEFNELKSGGLTIGYLPTEDYSQLKSLEHDGFSSNYWNIYGIDYMWYNYTGPAGKMFSQLYMRQAIQSLINQPQIIKNYYVGGVGTTENGPVPDYPANTKENPFLSKEEAGPLMYPFNPSHAVALLKSHGWAVHPKGTSVCAKAGTAADECGAGIKKGTPLTFSFLYAINGPVFVDEMTSVTSNWKRYAGMTATIRTPKSFDDVIADMSTTTWDLDYYDNGWVYSPDYLPTGEDLWLPGAGSNSGHYNNAEATKLIKLTDEAPTASSEIKAIQTYENYFTKELPVLWMPEQPQALTVYNSKLTGLVPQGIFDEIYPQDYSIS
ncbi:MAG: ABC transporter substrate-binding protein [Candidatus Dormiibacterota bacterium]